VTLIIFCKSAKALNKPPGDYDVQDWNLKELAYMFVRRWMMPLNEMIHSKSYQFKKYLGVYKKVIYKRNFYIVDGS